MEIKRRPFQGVLNILSFNRHFYIGGIIGLIIIIASTYIIAWPSYIFHTVIFAFSYGLCMPLLVSAYVYDYSGFYNFKWLRQMNIQDEKVICNLNINAGFDETSFIIKNILPNASLQVYDFYNAQQHTEPAIIRARKVSTIYPNTQSIDTNYIPLADNAVDTIFIISALHEIRCQKEKIAFLKECRRVCKPAGRIIMVEHLRDIPNFLAFTIGFTHFFSKSTWIKAYSAAGFNTIKETKFTPFMSIFTCQ